MAIDWKVVRPEHVVKACELVSTGRYQPRVKAKGIVVTHAGRELPAKQVLRLAYCFAKGLPLEHEVRFASGDGTIRLLQSLGFQASRATGSEQREDKTRG